MHTAQSQQSTDSQLYYLAGAGYPVR